MTFVTAGDTFTNTETGDILFVDRVTISYSKQGTVKCLVYFTLTGADVCDPDCMNDTNFYTEIVKKSNWKQNKRKVA